MDADVLGDDELEAGQPHAFVGQPAKLERELGIADVHHDLGRRRGHLVERDVDDLDVEQARVHWPVSPSAQRHRHRRAILQQLGRVAAADDGGNAELARDDRRVTGATRRGW